MQPPRAGATGCGGTTSSRTLHLQDARSRRWVRVDVLDDGAGSRTIVSERGGRRQVSVDPVRVATELAEPQTAPIGPAARTVRAHGLSVAVPTGWEVVEDASVDPCTLPGPSVVVADGLEPSCDAEQYARPTHPFLWLTSVRLEGQRLFTNDRSVVPVDPGSPASTVRWTDVSLDASGTVMTGLIGIPETGTGRLFLVGLDQDASVALRGTVRPE